MEQQQLFHLIPDDSKKPNISVSFQMYMLDLRRKSIFTLKQRFSPWGCVTVFINVQLSRALPGFVFMQKLEWSVTCLVSTPSGTECSKAPTAQEG